MKNIEKATNNMKMVYSILCNLKKCTIFELQKLTKFRDVDLSFRKEQLFLLLKAY